MMKTFLSGVFSKLPSMCNFYFINYGRFCGSPSWSQAIKIFYNGYRMERLHNPLIDSKLFHNSCNFEHLETITISRTCRCWGFNELKPNTLGLRHKSGLQNQFVFLKNHCGYFKNFSSFQTSYQEKNKTTAIYIIALVTLVLGGSYAAVPLYRIFCQASGLGGTVQQTDAGEKIKNMTAQKERLITVRFNADKSATMQWSFKPQQSEVKVYPGETALAFYTAKNPTEFPVTGISTYNVIPFEAGQYFNKIQCFCFEEQRLNPHEQVDMPVFFYIDPEFAEDPALYKVNTITLSYTFFQAKEAQDLGIQ